MKLFIRKSLFMNKMYLYASDVVMLFVRFALAQAFFKSGSNKWLGFLKFNPNTYDLFLYEFFCPEQVRQGALRLCSSETNDYNGSFLPFIIERFANIAGVMEILLPVCLIFGIFSRTAAFGLFTMALFIELFVFPDSATFWNVHIWWMAVSLAIFAHGPGCISIDNIFKKKI